MSTDYMPKYPGEFAGEYAIQSHLHLLALFLYLLNHIEDRPKQHSTHDNSDEKRIFLVSAEARYALYLDLASRTSDPYEIPLPPWDVAIVMHAHMLSPLQFQTDIGKERWNLQSARFGFPLQRLVRLMETGIWSDPLSKLQWESRFSQPYQQWTTYPLSYNERLPYQPYIIFDCLSCGSVSEISFSSWLALRLKSSSENEELKLTCCGPVKDESFLKYSFQKISQDLPSYSVSLHEESPSGSTIDDLQENKISCKIIHIKNGDEFSTVSKGSEEVRHTIWPIFSLDLVEAVLRQTEFAVKIISLYPSSLDLDTSLPRYLKFMNLMGTTSTVLVPHLDIDIFWHTHQLTGHVYDQFCHENFGKLINHDDTLSHGDLADGLENTKRAWKDVYQEEYRDFSERGNMSMGEMLFPVETTDRGSLVNNSTETGSAFIGQGMNASPSTINDQLTFPTTQEEQKMKAESLAAKHLDISLESHLTQEIAQTQKLVDSIYQRTQASIDEATKEYPVLVAELLPAIETAKAQFKSTSQHREELREIYSQQIKKHSLFRLKGKGEMMEMEKEIHELKLVLDEKNQEITRLEVKVKEAKVARDEIVRKAEEKRNLLTTQAHAGLGERVRVLNERRQVARQELFEKYGNNPVCWEIWRSSDNDFDPFQDLEDPPAYEETDASFTAPLDNLPAFHSSIQSPESKNSFPPEKASSNKLSQQNQASATPPTISTSSSTFRVKSTFPATAKSRERDKKGRDRYGAGISVFDMIFGPNVKGKVDSRKAKNGRSGWYWACGGGSGGGCGGGGC